jgi:hypothetical protein
LTEFSPEDESRARAAVRAVASIKAKLESGAEFRQPTAADFYARMRDATAKYGTRTFVSEGQLSWLTSIDERLKGKKK